MADDDELKEARGKLRGMPSGVGSSGPSVEGGSGSSGSGLVENEHGLTEASEGSTRRPGETRSAKFRDSGEGSTGINAVQMPNRPK